MAIDKSCLVALYDRLAERYNEFLDVLGQVEAKELPTEHRLKLQAMRVRMAVASEQIEAVRTVLHDFQTDKKDIFKEMSISEN